MSASMNKNNKNIEPFKGYQYSMWKFRVNILLDEEEVLFVLEKEVPEKIDDKWLKAEKTAKRIIVENLHNSMLIGIKKTDTARDIIKKLDDTYERESLTTQITIEKNLLSLQFNEDIPLLNHFMIFEEMLQDVEAAGSIMNEKNKIARLLLTLPKSYDPIATAIQTTIDGNLSLALVKSNLLEYEGKLKNERKDTSAKVLQTNTVNKIQKRKQKYRNNYKNYQSHNKQYNNKQSQKYNKQYRNTNNYNKNYNKCKYCGRRNHSEKVCFYKNKQFDSEEQANLQGAHASEFNDNFVLMSGVKRFIDEEKCDSNEITFLLDSGATDHVTNRDDIFSTIQQLKHPILITVAKKNVFIKATKMGTIKVISNQGVAGTIEDVLYAPEAPFNLLSVRRIQQNGMRITFKENGQVTIKHDGKIIAIGKLQHNLINVDFKLDRKMINQIEVKTNLNKLWHARLGHLSKDKFLEIKRNNLLINSNKLKNVYPVEDICEACIYGKQSRLPFANVKDKTYVTRPLFIIHSDVCGPIKPTTIDDKNYFVTFIDQYTHYTVVYLLKQKSDVFIHFQDFVRKSETHHNLKIAHIYCDNGREYLSNEFREFCVQKGIQYHLTVPYTPQQNSVAERMNRSLAEKARALLHGANLTKQLWGEAILTATYLINLTPTKSIEQNKTPYELWHQRKPRLDHLRIFGSTVYIHDKTRKNKFDKKSFKGILVGYQTNGYKILIAETNKFVIARDVIFDEVNFNTSRPIIQNDMVDNENSNFKKRRIDQILEVNYNNNSKIDELLFDSNNEVNVNNENDNLQIRYNEINKPDNEAEQIDQNSSNDDEISTKNKNSQIDKNEHELRRSVRIQKLPPLSYNE